jgi:hypothetical protein
MALLGGHERMSAQRAYEVGLVSRVVPIADLVATATLAAQAIASAPALVVQGTQRAIWMRGRSRDRRHSILAICTRTSEPTPTFSARTNRNLPRGAAWSGDCGSGGLGPHADGRRVSWRAGWCGGRWLAAVRLCPCQRSLQSDCHPVARGTDVDHGAGTDRPVASPACQPGPS